MGFPAIGPESVEERPRQSRLAGAACRIIVGTVWSLDSTWSMTVLKFVADASISGMEQRSIAAPVAPKRFRTFSQANHSRESSCTAMPPRGSTAARTRRRWRVRGWRSVRSRYRRLRPPTSTGGARGWEFFSSGRWRCRIWTSRPDLWSSYSRRR